MNDTDDSTGKLRSPQVTHLEWGRTEVEGLAPAKDVVLYPGGGHPWDWNVHGTRHTPGIQPGDVQELLDRGADVVVLSLGIDRVLQVDPATLDLLTTTGTEYHLADTRAAVELYNTLARTRPTGALLHSTC
ncbi:MTH938/NDUFAF3 family protein [Kitasatospora sp. NPDC048365]|uniref:MTH938/NDUFAF3 family protein n=1 Tax=Kitasatospora sp. NPDC048365 TaxID=3364050 RepID=UPI00370FF415